MGAGRCGAHGGRRAVGDRQAAPAQCQPFTAGLPRRAAGLRAPSRSRCATTRWPVRPGGSCTTTCCPTLAAPDGLDLPDYCEQLMTRFANPALRHSTSQVAMDGSQKLPNRVLGHHPRPLRRRRDTAGRRPRRCRVDGVRRQRRGRGVAAAARRPAARSARGRGGRAVMIGSASPTCCRSSEIFGDELSGSVVFRDLLVDQIAEARALSQR